jgi:hypothetical protein
MVRRLVLANLVRLTERRILLSPLSSSASQAALSPSKQAFLPNEANKSFVINVWSQKLRKIPPNSTIACALRSDLQWGQRLEWGTAFGTQMPKDDPTTEFVYECKCSEEREF